MNPTPATANPQEQKNPKSLKEVAAFCVWLESNVGLQLEVLQKAQEAQFQRLEELVLANKTTAISNNSNSEDESVIATIRAVQKQLESQIAAAKESIAKELLLVRSDIEHLTVTSTEHGDQIDAAEQYSRRNCLLIHGIAERPGEDVMDTVVKFVNGHLGDTDSTLLRYEDVDRAHRLGPVRTNNTEAAGKSRRPRPIILKLTRYIPRAMIWTRKRKLKDPQFLITESLTAIRVKLLAAAKQIAGNRNVWTQDGRIVVLRPDNSRLTLTRQRDLQSLHFSNHK
jgi:hypothetical protein